MSESTLRCGGCGVATSALRVAACEKCGYQDYYPPIQVWQPLDSKLSLHNTISGGIRIDIEDEQATVLQVAAEDLWRIPSMIILLWEFVKTLPVEQ